MSSPPRIAFQHVTKRFPGAVALDDVSFDVQRGSLHAIVGENGAGKSTLMKILSGVVTDYSGQLLLDGAASRFGGTRDAEAAGIAIIHQELNLVEDLSVAANIFLGRERRTRLGFLDDRAMRREATALLAQLECPVSADSPVRRLRVGDQQLVEIAKALSLSAEILIMDEPTSALTETEVARLYRVIAKLRERRVTVIYISHKMEEVFRLSDRITVLRDGRMVKSLDRSATHPGEITGLMVGRELGETRFAPRWPGEELLRVARLSLPWPGHARGWRLRDLSFSLHRGEVVGVAGLMGAGRTELLECLYGASPEPPEGRIVFDGHEVRFRHPAEALAAGIAMVSEDRKRLGLFADLDVGANIGVSALHRAAPSRWLSRRRERALAGAMVSRLGVKTPSLAARITGLSGGNQQKAVVGRGLLTEPKLLLLDDPTRGVDVGAKAEIYQVIDRLCRDGMAILVTSSELPELLVLCDRILVLAEGQLTAEFSKSEATEARILAAAMGGVEKAEG